MFRFMTAAGHGDYESLYRWSVTELAAFWSAVASFVGIRFHQPAATVIAHPERIMAAGWFRGATLNYAEHLLRHRGRRDAIVAVDESGRRRTLSFDELRREVAGVAASLEALGVAKGDRVAGFLPNCPEAMIAMLATVSRGAIWSSCSPDFGVRGVIDRFGQIRPKVLFTADAYDYNGKRYDSLATARELGVAIDSIEATIAIDFTGSGGDVAGGFHRWQDVRSAGAELVFVPVEFDHPLFILYSSGTTGVPKCMVHGHGGTLLQHLKEHVLHTDLSERDRLLYFTTCGWMMWNWLASALASGTTLVLYDGSPFLDRGRRLWRLASEEGVSVFGTSAKYLAAVAKAGRRPGHEFDLNAMRTVLSTGSPLAPEGFDFVYREVKADVQLSSIAGGTDIVSCFVLGNPLLPVRRGEIQCRGLGMAVEVFDADGCAVLGTQGELVCTRPFPSAPVGFFNDPDGLEYRAAYFDTFDGVWAHGDYAELTAAGGLIIHGRSDTVLNPGGVRIGTAEIYRQVEQLDEVLDSIAVGQKWKDDVRVVLFVVLREDVELDEQICKRIRRVIRDNATPRHVPARILAVPEIPRTRSGKIVELAVRCVVHGEPVRNTAALANPEALEFFRDRPELDA